MVAAITTEEEEAEEEAVGVQSIRATLDLVIATAAVSAAMAPAVMVGAVVTTTV